MRRICTTTASAVINLQSGRLIDRWKCGPPSLPATAAAWRQAACREQLGRCVRLSVRREQRQADRQDPRRPASHRHALAEQTCAQPKKRDRSELRGTSVCRGRQHQQRLFARRYAGRPVQHARIHQRFAQPHASAGHDAFRAGDRQAGHSSVRRLFGCKRRRGRRYIRPLARACSGFIPTGWYPTAVRILDDDQLSRSERQGPGKPCRIPTARIRPGPTSRCIKAARCRARLRGAYSDRHRCISAARY